MRRGSVVGPLILIALGVLFLVNNLRPDLPLLEILGRSWPFILIAWGGLRLVEILIWAMQSRPLPRAGVSGGEWALVILISVIGSGLSVAQRHSGFWPKGRITMGGIEMFGESYDFPLSAQKTAGKAPRVVIENLRGHTRIVGADSEEVKLTGRKTIRALAQGDANAANQQSPLEMISNGDRIVIRTNQDRVSGEQRVSADLDVTVPRGATIEARGRYGDFDISDIDGGVAINSDNAGVRLNNVAGPARLDLDRSDVVRVIGLRNNLEVKSGRGQDLELENIAGQVTVNGSFSGDIQLRNLAKPVNYESGSTTMRMERIPGQVRMALGNITAEDVVGPVRLSTKSKDVEITNFTEGLEVTLERGDIEIRPGRLPLGRMEIETRNGNVELALPAAAKFQVNALARNGQIDNEYGEPLVVEEVKGREKNRESRMSGNVGGGPVVKMTTGRGRILLRKAGENEGGTRRAGGPPAALPPARPERPPLPERPLKVETH